MEGNEFCYLFKNLPPGFHAPDLFTHANNDDLVFWKYVKVLPQMTPARDDVCVSMVAAV